MRRPLELNLSNQKRALRSLITFQESLSHDDSILVSRRSGSFGVSHLSRSHVLRISARCRTRHLLRNLLVFRLSRWSWLQPRLFHTCRTPVRMSHRLLVNRITGKQVTVQSIKVFLAQDKASSYLQPDVEADHFVQYTEIMLSIKGFSRNRILLMKKMICWSFFRRRWLQPFLEIPAMVANWIWSWWLVSGKSHTLY